MPLSAQETVAPDNTATVPIAGNQAPSVGIGTQVISPLPQPAGDEKADLELWREFRKQNLALKTDTQSAVNRALVFLRSSSQTTPALHPRVAVEAWSAMGYVTYTSLKDLKGAHKLYDEALSLYEKTPYGAALLVEKARLFLYAGRPAPVEALMKSQWKSLVLSDSAYARPLLWQYGLALKAVGKSADLAPWLQKALLEMPSLLDESGQGSEAWMYRFVIESLLAKGQADQALSWAKLGWMECAFDEVQIQSFTTFLSKTWQQKEVGVQPTTSALQAFLTSQEAPLLFTTADVVGAPPVSATRPNRAIDGNPLAEVAMPAIDSDAVQEKLLTLSSNKGDVFHAASTHRRISLLILSQEWKRAITEAKQLWLDQPQSNLGLKEITRVFKAHDLSIARANAFIRWNQDRRGPNPADIFLAEVGR